MHLTWTKTQTRKNVTFLAHPVFAYVLPWRDNPSEFATVQIDTAKAQRIHDCRSSVEDEALIMAHADCSYQQSVYPDLARSKHTGIKIDSLDDQLIGIIRYLYTGSSRQGGERPSLCTCLSCGYRRPMIIRYVPVGPTPTEAPTRIQMFIRARCRGCSRKNQQKHATIVSALQS